MIRSPLHILVLLSAAAFLGALALLLSAPHPPGSGAPRAGVGLPAPAGTRDGSSPGGRWLTPPIRAALEGRETLTPRPLAPGSLDGKVVVVTFFASWCPPCRQELAQLKFLAARHGPQGLVVLAINHFETFDGLSDRGRLQAFLTQLAPNYPVLAGDDSLAETFGGVDRIPTLLLFDRQGEPAARIINTSPERSAMDLTALEQRILQLL